MEKDFEQTVLDAMKDAMPKINQHPCPSCGYCPHCGRGGQQAQPWVILMPYVQPYLHPWHPSYPTITWSGTNTFNGKAI